MDTLVKSTFPVFFAVNVYLMTSPAIEGSWIAEASADLVNCIAGAGVNGVSVFAGGGVTGGPVGGVPVEVASFTTWPALMSAWVMAYVAVAVTVSPGSNVPVAPGQV
jgi:hypothetical protein